MTAEIVLRFLPVGSGLKPPPVTQDFPLFRETPNRTFTGSRGWNFSISNNVHVNNHGFVNHQDYSENLDKPVVAVIGDSYVEALMTPYAETLHGRAAKDYKDAYFYSFGASGAQLPQYLAYARYDRKHLGAALLEQAILVPSNARWTSLTMGAAKAFWGGVVGWGRTI